MALTSADKLSAGLSIASMGLTLLSSARASKARAFDLRNQAQSLIANAISLRFDANQEKIKGRLDGILANTELNKAQSSNLVNSLARGVEASGSSTQIQTTIAKESDFFRAVTKVSSELTALNLKRVARAEEEQAVRLEKAAKEAESSFLGIF